jgi:hypothetical protein
VTDSNREEALRAAAEEALRRLRRLSDTTEIGGFGDADASHNSSPEMRSRLTYARHSAEVIEQMLGDLHD